MYHSHWELEVFARDVRQRRLDEAAHARQLDIAGEGQGRGSGLTRLAAAVRARFSPHHDGAAAPLRGGMSPAPSSAVAADAPGAPASSRLRSADPFAAMLVLARGAVESPEQPCAVSDC